MFSNKKIHALKFHAIKEVKLHYHHHHHYYYYYCQHIKSSSSHHHYYCVAILRLLLLIIIIIVNTWSHCQAIIIIIMPLLLVIIIIIIYLFFTRGLSWTTQFHPYTCTAQLPAESNQNSKILIQMVRPNIVSLQRHFVFWFATSLANAQSESRFKYQSHPQER